MKQEVDRRDLLQTLTVGGVTVALSGCGMNFMSGNDGDRTDTAGQSRTPKQGEKPMQSQRQQIDDRQDQVTNGRFAVKIDGTEVSGFQHVTIPESRTQTVEGRDSEHQKQLWGQTEFDDLVLERPIIKGDSTLRDWRDQVRQGKIETALKQVSVLLLTGSGETAIEWRFTNAWPKEYEPPELVSGGNEAATETCTIAFDEMRRVGP